MASEKRKAGTGSVQKTPSGRWVAKSVGGQRHLGTFDTKREAQEAIAADNANPENARRASRATNIGISKGIGRYLALIAEGSTGAGGNVMLGALAGFPSSTDDPKVLAKAIEHLKANPPVGAVAMLKRQQRIIDLQRALDALEETAEGTSPRDVFIANAREWAIDNGIGYAAFRGYGVPADVLKQAGITRAELP